MDDGCPGALGAEPVEAAGGLDVPEEPDFCPQEGTTARKKSNPAAQERARNRFMVASQEGKLPFAFQDTPARNHKDR